MRWVRSMVKATPLLMIALGLAVCFRSNVWNIGAEGQFVIGAVFAGGVALLAGRGHRPLDRRCRSCWPASLGGMAWAGIVALLRDKLQRQRDPGQPDAGLRGRAWC